MHTSVDPTRPVLRYSAERGASATLELAGFRCSTHAAEYSGSGEGEVSLPRHLFQTSLDGVQDHIVEEWWDGRRRGPHRRQGIGGALFVPGGRSWAISAKGSSSIRYLSCEIEPAAFLRLLGVPAERCELRLHSGPSPILPGIAERLAAACEAPDEMPRSYVEATATLLVVELFRALATDPDDLELGVDAGQKRFDLVRAFIEESLAEDISLLELAGLVGLSPAQFSVAFRTAHRMTVHRYILRRRLERAKSLLRNTDHSVQSVAAQVGFTDELRFARTFARLTRATPQAYRAG